MCGSGVCMRGSCPSGVVGRHLDVLHGMSATCAEPCGLEAATATRLGNGVSAKHPAAMCSCSLCATVSAWSGTVLRKGGCLRAQAKRSACQPSQPLMSQSEGLTIYSCRAASPRSTKGLSSSKCQLCNSLARQQHAAHKAQAQAQTCQASLMEHALAAAAGQRVWCTRNVLATAGGQQAASAQPWVLGGQSGSQSVRGKPQHAALMRCARGGASPQECHFATRHGLGSEKRICGK